MHNTEIIRPFADNGMLFETIKNVVLKYFLLDNPATLHGLDDKAIGEIVRARLDGRQKVEDAFREIALYKTTEIPKEKINRAR